MVMGVQGSGKSTLGSLLAERLGRRFVDGDALHPQINIDLMAAGVPLDDDMRMPWLHAVAAALAGEEPVVVACSALKRSYRDLIREQVPDLFVVDPEGPMAVVAERIHGRHHEYMPESLLKSQYDTLEPLAPDERGVIVDLRLTPQQQVDAALAALGA